jgi:NAD(P)H dehydrogenase (quinone)
VVYHSGYGHTQKQAEAVAEGVAVVDGVECDLIAVADLERPPTPKPGQRSMPATP